MGRKRKTEYPLAGRPPKDPLAKMGTPARALVSDPVANALVEASKLHGIPTPRMGKISSDIVRLGLHMLLSKDGLMTSDLAQDDTWKSLQQMGLV